MKKTLFLAALIGVSLAAADGASLFKKCAACHGVHGEKHALGKSKIIKDLAPADIVTAVKGYQAGTYGGAMKGLMKGQVAGLTDDQIKTIAEYIGAK